MESEGKLLLPEAGIARQIERVDYRKDAHEPRPQNVGNLERVASIVLGSGLAVAGLAKRGASGWVLAGLGAAGVYRGMTGHCHAYDAVGVNTAKHPPGTVIPAKQGVKVEKTIHVQASPEELYAFWRDVENLPRIMRHLESVVAHDRERSRWRAEGPFGVHAEWEAVIEADRENELIAWRSEEGSDVDTAGSVRFEPLGHDRGTAVHVSLQYLPPGGKLAARLAKLFGGGMEAEIDEDLRRFKAFMETGEFPTVAGQPHGPRGTRAKLMNPFTNS